MLFSAYFDGSGKLHEAASDHVVLAGVVFYAERVGEFGLAWIGCLKEHSKKVKRPIVRYFHATDAMRCKGDFLGWHPNQVGELTIDLARLTRDHSYSLICAPANKASFRELPDRFRRKLQGLNELSFEVCINELLHQLGKHDQLHIACDDDEDEAIKVYKFLCRYKTRYPNRRDKFAALCFADDRFHPALQAADFLAYVQREEWDRSLSKDGRTAHPLVREFDANGTSALVYEWAPDEDGLGSAKRIVP